MTMTSPTPHEIILAGIEDSIQRLKREMQTECVLTALERATLTGIESDINELEARVFAWRQRVSGLAARIQDP